jgi:hypothetical protein
MPTLDEVKAADAAVEKKKADAMKEYLTIPPDGKPPNVEPPPEALSEAQLAAQEAEIKRKADEKQAAEDAKKTPHPTQGHATQAPANVPKHKDDDDDDRVKPPAGRGR